MAFIDGLEKKTFIMTWNQTKSEFGSNSIDNNQICIGIWSQISLIYTAQVEKSVQRTSSSHALDHATPHSEYTSKHSGGGGIIAWGKDGAKCSVIMKENLTYCKKP